MGSFLVERDGTQTLEVDLEGIRTRYRSAFGEAPF